MNSESSNTESSIAEPVSGTGGSAHPASNPHGAAERYQKVPESMESALQPQHVRVNQTEGTGIEITWKDGHTSEWSFTWLRDACPCAACVKERELSGRAIGAPRPQPIKASSTPKPPMRPFRTRAIGNYAVSFDWNDGHRTGIYSWWYLRSVCQCPTCVAERA